MPAIIYSVENDSIASSLGLEKGDEILSVDGKKLTDLLDYKYSVFAEEIELHVKHSDNNEEIFEIEKDFDEELGINFESPVFDKIKKCANKCMFCFVDQQPNGLRDSLYIKDDDYRLSYLQGTYVTLTNLTNKDRERIKNLRLGPLYVSVHTTNPALRQKMLGNPKAANILTELKWLNRLDIPVHAQIVLCHGLNDGQELVNTLNDLANFKSNILSIAVVPVGITKFREENVLARVTPVKAQEVISLVNDFNKKLGISLAHASDEFYILANNNFPCAESYNEFGQLEDGVGACRLLIDSFNLKKHKLPKVISNNYEFTIATGQIAANCLKPITDELNKIQNLKVNLTPVKSNFWGDDITVSGLITGQDLLDAFLPLHDKHKNLVIPSVMLRQYTDLFLDNYTVSDISRKLGANIITIKDYYSCDEIIDMVGALNGSLNIHSG